MGEFSFPDRPLKVGIISQARMTSTRLPGKVLIPVDGKSVLHYHIQRLKNSNLPVFIATTSNPSDDPVIKFCDKNYLPFFRGDEQNVLSRYYYCAKENNLDVIIRVTSDCPLISGELIAKACQLYLSAADPYLYLSNALERTFPRGFDFEIFSFFLLERSFKEAVLPEDLEHVTPYIHQNRTGDINFNHIKNSKDKSSYRITLDTQEDLDLIRILIEQHKAHVMSPEEIINLLDLHPELVKINSLIEQKKLTG